MPFDDLLILLILGLVAGVLGGLLGIGGSLIMIPVLTLWFGRDQHVSQAAAMIVNVFVAIPATIGHTRARVVRGDVLKYMLPAGIVAILIGVSVSNFLDATLLMRLFGVFLLYIVFFNLQRFFSKPVADPLEPVPVYRGRTSFVGGLMGFLAGLLGIGGGVLAVPLLQRVCNLPLRQCIGASSAVMCLTAAFGAIHKNISLAVRPEIAGGAAGNTAADSTTVVLDSLILAAALSPTALVGGMLGAWLTHRLPLRSVQVAFSLLIGYVGLRMIGVV